MNLIDSTGMPQKVTVTGQSAPHCVGVADLPAGVAPMSVWRLKLPASRQRLFRCIAIRESDNGGYAVTALQHIPEKAARVDAGKHFAKPPGTERAMVPPAVQHLRVTFNMEGGTITAMARWEVLRTVASAHFEIRVTLGNNDTGQMVTSQKLDKPECIFTFPGTGSYCVTVCSVNAVGQRSDPTSVLVGVKAPDSPVQVDVTPGYFQVTLVPHQRIYEAAIRFEFWFSTVRLKDPQQADSEAQYLGEGTSWIKDGLKPGTESWFYIRSVNAIGKSPFIEKSARPSDKAEDYLNFYKGKITQSHLGDDLLKHMSELEEGAAKIDEIQKSWKDTEGNLNTQWSVKLQQMKNWQYCMAGFGMGIEEKPEGMQSQILIAADRVAFVNPANGNSVPALVIEHDEIYFRDALIKHLRAVSIISSGIPPTFHLTPEGNLTARNADISGNLCATSGELEHVRIKDSCVIDGVLDAKQITGDIYNVQSGGVTLPKGVFSWSDKAGEHVVFRIDGESFDRILEPNLTLTAECFKNRQQFKLIIRHHLGVAIHVDRLLAHADTGNKGKSPGMNYRLNGISLPAIGRSHVHEFIMVINNSGRNGGVVCKAPPGEMPKFTAYRAGRTFVTDGER